MKISKIFHWLYFTVMMLPCVIIPIFAIYTRNENYNSNIEVQVEGNLVLEHFNQILTPNNSPTRSNYEFTITKTNSGSQWFSQGRFGITLDIGHKYYVKIGDYNSSSSLGSSYWLLGGASGAQVYVNDYPQGNVVTLNGNDDNNLGLIMASDVAVNTVYTGYLNVIDLTKIYGSGNEPTLSQASTIFNETYYEYTLDKDLLVPNQIITYNDTDVGSQFVYTLYNATDKYFNFDNFFGLNNVYSWIQLNWFSGNAPLGFAIFWHFFTYWLLASLAWLLFDVMIYVPLMIHRWMDKGAIE